MISPMSGAVIGDRCTLRTPRSLLVTNLGILATADAADYYNRPLEPRRPNPHLGELQRCIPGRAPADCSYGLLRGNYRSPSPG
jgi:hypothetical protein